MSWIIDPLICVELSARAQVSFSCILSQLTPFNWDGRKIGKIFMMTRAFKEWIRLQLQCKACCTCQSAGWIVSAACRHAKYYVQNCCLNMQERVQYSIDQACRTCKSVQTVTDGCVNWCKAKVFAEFRFPAAKENCKAPWKGFGEVQPRMAKEILCTPSTPQNAIWEYFQ